MQVQLQYMRKYFSYAHGNTTSRLAPNMTCDDSNLNLSEARCAFCSRKKKYNFPLKRKTLKLYGWCECERTEFALDFKKGFDKKNEKNCNCIATETHSHSICNKVALCSLRLRRINDHWTNWSRKIAKCSSWRSLISRAGFNVAIFSSLVIVFVIFF